MKACARSWYHRLFPGSPTSVASGPTAIAIVLKRNSAGPATGSLNCCFEVTKASALLLTTVERNCRGSSRVLRLGLGSREQRTSGDGCSSTLESGKEVSWRRIGGHRDAGDTAAADTDDYTEVLHSVGRLSRRTLAAEGAGSRRRQWY